MMELEKYRECDPAVLEQIKKESVVAMEAANRWTGDDDDNDYGDSNDRGYCGKVQGC